MQKKLDIRRQRRTQMEGEAKAPSKDEKPPAASAAVAGKAVPGRIHSGTTSFSPSHKPAVRASRSAPLKNGRSPADQGAMQQQQQVWFIFLVISI